MHIYFFLISAILFFDEHGFDILKTLVEHFYNLTSCD